MNAQYWFEQAAMQDHVTAQYALGKLYLSGDMEVHSTQEGLRWLETAAQNGSHYAAYHLGKDYLKGKIVEKDTAQATKRFTRSAEAGNQYTQFFLDRQNDFRPPSVMLSVTRLLHHMSRLFQDHSLPPSSNGIQIDRKRRQQLREKKIALGHKADDQEEQTQGGTSMMM